MSPHKPLRLRDFDYSNPGLYFITICTHQRRCLLGNVVGDSVDLGGVGLMVEKWWGKLPEKFAGIELDEFMIMPNHLHGIINIVGVDPRVDPKSFPSGNDLNASANRAASLPRMIQWFKTMSTNEYLRKKRGGKLWQRNYYEHVIRDEQELYDIRKYIINNPLKWALDPENPENR